MVPELGGLEAEFDRIYENTGTTFQPPLDGKFLDFSISFDQMLACVPHGTYVNLTVL